MAKPVLDDVKFPKLSKSSTSTGTVTSGDVKKNDTVKIYGKNKKRWSGKVGDKVSGNDWSATVDPDKEGKEGKGIEAISVTVTNASSETSDPEPSTSDIIP